MFDFEKIMGEGLDLKQKHLIQMFTEKILDDASKVAQPEHRLRFLMVHDVVTTYQRHYETFRTQGGLDRPEGMTSLIMGMAKAIGTFVAVGNGGRQETVELLRTVSMVVNETLEDLASGIQAELDKKTAAAAE